MKKVIRNLTPKNSFTRSVGLLVGGALGSQILLVLIAPILTRLYSPEDFGTLATFVAILSMISVISSFRYEIAIPLPTEVRDAEKVVLLSLILLLIFSLLTGLIVLLWGTKISDFMNTPELHEYLWILPIAVLISGVYKVFNYWAVRLNSFGSIAKTKIKQAIVTIIIQLCSFKYGALGLISGQAIGQGAGISALGKSAKKCFNKENFSLKDIKRLAVSYKEFPIYSTFSGFVNIGGQQAMPILLASLYGLSIAGLYALTARVMTAPLIMLGRSIGQVFLGHGAEAYREKELAVFVTLVFEKLLFVAIPVVLVIALFSPDLFNLIFGNSWKESGYIAQLLTLSIFGQFLCSPLSQVLAITGRQKLSMLLNTVLFLARVLVVVFVSFLGSYLDAILGYSIVSLVGYLLFIIFIFKASKVNFSFLGKYILDFAIMFSVLWLVIFSKLIDFEVLHLLIIFSVHLIFHFFKNKRIIKNIWYA